MSDEALDRLERLFRAAQRRSPEERAAFLDAACADDATLRQELESLLRADEDAEAEAFLQDPVAGSIGALFDALHGQEDHVEGKKIGPYTVQRRLGQGGMGDVYLAVREEPFRRRVALKVIRQEVATKEAFVRFALERQILASLNHPHIARLYDGGVTDEGQPYLVMEVVEGQPITTYCDERRLPLYERIRLFQTVCRAVHYAHQNLIIHRDLKPSNIFVTDDGTVKLLDFGIAKLLNPNLSPAPLPVTRTGLHVMTPEYASPEQVRGGALTTASDVYALGVLLYELLTGHRPYQVAGRPTHEIIAVVCEQEPELPSTRIAEAETISHSNGAESVIAPEAVSAARNLSVERLQRRLRGDLDTITLMALRKEPARRYRSAEQLAQDLERHLSGLPVTACPDTVWYRVQKFATRHRAAVLSVLLVGVSLVGGFGTALWQAHEARQERDRARVEAQRTQATADFLKGLFQATDPDVAQGDTLTAYDLLERGTRRIERELADQPVVRSDMLLTLGQVYHNLGRFDEALDMTQAAYETRRQLYGPDHVDAVGIRLHQGLLHLNRGEIEQSVTMLRDVVGQYRRLLPPDAPELVTALTSLAAALRFQDIAQNPESLREAEALLREARAIEQSRSTPDSLRLADTLKRLAYLARDQGHPADAEALHRESLTLLQGRLGGRHPSVANTLINIGAVLADQGRYDESIAFFQRGLAIRRAVQGHDHVDVAIDQAGMGEVYWKKNEYETAEIHLRAALDQLRRSLPADHLRVTAVMRNLSDVLMRQGKPDEARAVLEELLRLEQGKLNNAYWTAVAQRRLGESLAALGRYDTAERLLRASYATLGTSHPDDRETHLARQNLVDLYRAWNRPSEADRYRVRAEAGPER